MEIQVNSEIDFSSIKSKGLIYFFRFFRKTNILGYKVVKTFEKNLVFAGYFFKTWEAETHFAENRRVRDFLGWRVRDGFRLPGASARRPRWFRC